MGWYATSNQFESIMWQDWAWKRNLDFGHIMWWSWENVDKKFLETCCLKFCTNIHFFSINKWIKVNYFVASAFLLQYLGRVWSVWSIQMGAAGRSRLSQADPLMDIPCSGITETSVHHVIVEVFYIGQTSSVFCEKRRAVHVQAYHAKLSKCHIRAWLTL